MFVGGANATDIERVGVVQGLLSGPGDARVAVYGPPDQWEAFGVEVTGEVWGQDASVVERTAKVCGTSTAAAAPVSGSATDAVLGFLLTFPRLCCAQVALSISRQPALLAMYHSDRLLRQTASGCCVASNLFRGLELLFPPHCVEAVDEKGWGQAVEGLLGDAERRLRMRRRSADVTWRRHTWEDSVRKFLLLARTHSRPAQSEAGGGHPPLLGNYHSRLARALLARGDAADALVHCFLALEATPADASLARGASAAAALSGQDSIASRLQAMARRLKPPADQRDGDSLEGTRDGGFWGDCIVFEDEGTPELLIHAGSEGADVSHDIKACDGPAKQRPVSSSP